MFGDTLDQTDGVSVKDGITAGASIGALVGMVWGSRLPWGPVTGAVVGLIGGGLVGLLFDRLIPEKRRDMYQTKKLKGLMQIEVTCDSADRTRLAKRILEKNQADQLAVVFPNRFRDGRCPNDSGSGQECGRGLIADD